MSEPIHSFEAHAFNPGLGSEVVPGNILLDRRALYFQSDAVSLAIPLSRLEVEVINGEDERIFFRDSEQPDWSVYTTDFSVLDHHALSQAGGVRDRVSADESRRELMRRLKITGYALGVCAVVAWACWSVTGLMVRSLVRRIPAEWEQKYGDSLLEEAQKEMELSDDTNAVARLAAAAAPLMRVVPAGKKGFTFHIIEEPEPNAFALPGGHVFVTTGMLQLVDRPEELLGALAHETAHVTEKHGFRTEIAAAGPFILFGIFLRGGDGLTGLFSGGSGLLVQQGFSQEFETEADLVGWNYLVAANIDPRGAIDLLRKLKSYDQRLGVGDLIPAAFESHPQLDKRIARLESKWKKLSHKGGFLELPPLDIPGTKK